MIAQRKSRPVVLKCECDLSVGYVLEEVFKGMSFVKAVVTFPRRSRENLLSYLSGI